MHNFNLFNAFHDCIGSRGLLAGGIPLLMVLVHASLTAAAVAPGVPSALRVTGTSELGGLEVEGAENLYAALHDKGAATITDFPLGWDRTVALQLERFAVTTPATRIVRMTDAGEEIVAPPQIALFRGHVAEMPDARVYLAVTPDRVHGMIEDVAESYVLVPENGTRGDQPGRHFLRRRSEMKDLISADYEECAVGSEQVPNFVPPDLDLQMKKAAFRTCRVAIECDFEFWQAFNDMDDALAHIYTIMGSVTAFYESDLSVKLSLPFIRIWTTVNDPYSFVGGAITGLHEFQNYWRANHNPGDAAFVERDLAHLMSSRGVGAWGNIGQLCSYDNGFSISGGNAGHGNQEFEHDTFFVGHEIGHNFNGIHTHCFNPPVDQCATEGGCNQTQDCSTAPGTIMSYCHNCSGAYLNILHQFSAQNIARIRPHIDASCLGLALDPVYVNWTNTGTENGTISNPYDTVAEGTWYALPNGTVIISVGSYDEPMTLWQPLTLRSTNGSAVIGK